MKDMDFFLNNRQNWDLHLRIAAKIVGLVLLMGIYGYFCFYSPYLVKERLQSEYAVLSQRLDWYETASEREVQLMNHIERMDDKQIHWRTVEQGNPHTWYTLLNAFDDAVPFEVAIGQMIFDDRRLTLSGSTAIDKSAAKFLLNLENSGKYEQLRLERISYGEKITFEITGVIR